MAHQQRRSAGPRPAALALLGALIALPVVPGCDGGDDPGPAPATPEAESSRARRDVRPEALEARRLLGLGRADLARPLVSSLVDALPVEGRLLRARLTFLEGDAAGWLVDVEAARAEDPADPRPYAAAVELYAALDRRLAAKEELERGIAAVGALTPELRRAGGVLSIVTPGRWKQGLAMLEEAERIDPGLPFMARPLGQAHLLAAKMAFADGAQELALERIETSLGYDPDDVEARRMKGEYLISLRRFEKGLELLEELLAEGVPIGVELGNYHWMAGVRDKLMGEVAGARRHFLRARTLGEPKVERNEAKKLLDSEAEKAFQLGLERLADGDEDGCRAALAEAVGLWKSAAAARTHFAGRLAELAEGRIEAGELEAATPLISAALHLDAESPATAVVTAAFYFEKALAAYSANEADVAVAFAAQAATAGSNDPFMWQFLGELQYSQRDFGAASGSLQRAHELSKALGEVLELDAHVKLAHSMVLMGEEADAKGHLQRAIAKAEANGGADPAALERAREFIGTL